MVPEAVASEKKVTRKGRPAGRSEVNSGPRSSRYAGSRRKASACFSGTKKFVLSVRRMKERVVRKIVRRNSSSCRCPVLYSSISFVTAASAASYAGSRSAISGSNRSSKRRVSWRAMSGWEWNARETSSRVKRWGWLWARLVWQKPMKAFTSDASSPVIRRVRTNSRYTSEPVARIWVL